MSDPHFANARSVRNALEDARLRHAQITLTVHPERFPELRQIFDLAVAAALACP